MEAAPAQEAPAEAAPVAEVTAIAETTPPGIAIAEQVEPVTEPIPAEEPAIVAVQPQPVIAEASAVPEEPEAEEPA